MRGTKAKALRRQAYGPGNAMPRAQPHEYQDINGPVTRWVTNPARSQKGVINPLRVPIQIPGTLVIISARRLYQRLKRGQEVQVFHV